jgi:hypothetical protein
MSRANNYTDVRGHSILLEGLDKEERGLLQTLQKFAQDQPDWNAFSNFWLPQVAEFYKKRGLTRSEIRATILYRVGQDLGSRLAFAAGLAQLPDYRDDLEELIRSQFATRRQFCEATGISEDMLSHVLAKRKHLAIQTLVEALQRIGYGLHIQPQGEKKVS